MERLTFRTTGGIVKRGFEAKWSFVILALFFRLVLEVGYWVYVSPIHSYSGFVWSPSLVKCFESWGIYLALVVFAPYRLIKPSDFFVVILLFGLMAPLLSFYGLTDQPRLHLYIVIMGYLLIDAFRRGRPLRFSVLREGRQLALMLVILGITGVSVWFVVSGGIAFFNLDLTKVYLYRADAGAVISYGIMGYVNEWAWKVFGPALLAIALWKRVYWLAVVVFGLHVFWFGVSAHKSVLFYPFLVLFLWLWFRRTMALSIVPLCMSGVVSAVLLIFVIFGEGFPASLFIRRAFYVLANNTFDYYEFFSMNPKVWWSNSMITMGLLNSPYELDPTKVIGIWRGTDEHVNNTFLSTGFMHAGVAGVVLYGILAGLLFRLVDSLAVSGIPVWVALSVLIVPSRALLLSADLPTSLLTHGIGVGIMILFFLRSRHYDQHLLISLTAKGDRPQYRIMKAVWKPGRES